MNEQQSQEVKNELVKNIIGHSDAHGNLFHKFSCHYLVKAIQMQKLYSVSKWFKPSDKLQIEEFVALVASMISHESYENLFLILSLIDLYRELESKKNASRCLEVRFSDFTDLFCEVVKIVCQKIIDRDPCLILPEKQNIAVLNYAQIHHQSPSVKYLCQHQLPVLEKSLKSKERTLKNPISQFKVASSLNRIISLGLISSTIDIYTKDLKKEKQIRPKISKKMKKQFIILSFAFDQSNQRIGYILKNVGLIFCENSDNFETQKLIEQINAQKIVFIKFLRCWGTINKNSLHFWNIVEQKQFLQITIDEAVQLNCLQEIDHLDKIIASYTYKNETRWLHIYEFSTFNSNFKKWNLIHKIQIESNGCHTLHYNKITQSIVRLGYHHIVNVYQIDQLCSQLILVSKLEGHRSIVTAVASVPQTCVLVTGDDQGYIRVWNLAYMRCLQLIRLSQEIKIMDCFQQWLLLGDKRMNMIPIDIPKKDYMADDAYFTACFDDWLQNLFLFTHHSCIHVSMESGNLIETLILCANGEQITCVKKIGKKIYLGTNKGNLIIFDFQFQNKKQYHLSEDQIISILSDSEQLLIIILSESSVKIWLQQANFQDGSRKSLTNLSPDIRPDSISFSDRDCLFAFNLHNEVYLFDYETIKLACKFEIPFPVSFIQFHHLFSVLLLVSEDGQLLAVNFRKQEVRIQILGFYNVIFPGMAQIQDELITCFNIGEQDKMYIATNKGNLYCFSLEPLISCIQKSSKKRKLSERSIVIHRPIKQKFNKYQLFSNQIHNLETLNKVKSINLPIVYRRNLAKRNSITHMNVFESNNFLSTICYRGIFRIFEIANLKCIGLRKGKNTTADKWEKISISVGQVRDKVIEGLKITESILNYNFRDDLIKFIDFEGLDVVKFIENIFQKKRMPYVEMKHTVPIGERMQAIYHSRNLRLSVPNLQNVPLKFMEIEKRLKQIQQCKKEQVKSIKRPFLKSKKTLSGYYQTPDQFFSPKYRQNLMKLPSRKEQTSCQLYDNLNKKFSSLEHMIKGRSKTKLPPKITSFAKTYTLHKQSPPSSKQTKQKQKQNFSNNSIKDRVKQTKVIKKSKLKVLKSFDENVRKNSNIFRYTYKNI